jgi:hypothetical protein
MSDLPSTKDFASPQAAPPRLYRLSVEKYNQMAQLGVLTKVDRIELIEGLMVEKIKKSAHHLTTTWMIQRALRDAFPEGWLVVTDSPVILARSELEPDVMLLRGRVEDYFGRKPNPADVALVVEVSDSSYADDRARLVLYSEAAVPVYWIANIPAGRIEVYSDPARIGDSFGYLSRRDHGRDDKISLDIKGQAVVWLAVRNLLAPPE